MYEIVFDEDFLGGLQLRCSSARAYYLPPSCLLNISYGKRREGYQRYKSSEGKSHSYNSYATAVATTSNEQGRPIQHYNVHNKESSFGTRSMEHVHQKGSKMKKQVKIDNHMKPPQILSRKKDDITAMTTTSTTGK